MSKSSQKPTSCSHHHFDPTPCTRNPRKTSVQGKTMVLLSGTCLGEMDLISFAQSSAHVRGRWSPFLGIHPRAIHNYSAYLSANKALAQELSPWVKQRHKTIRKHLAQGIGHPETHSQTLVNSNTKIGQKNHQMTLLTIQNRVVLDELSRLINMEHFLLESRRAVQILCTCQQQHLRKPKPSIF